MEPLYVWGCELLYNVDGRRVKVALKRLHHAPTTWVHRPATKDRHQQLMDEVIALHGSWVWVPIFVMHVELGKETP